MNKICVYAISKNEEKFVDRWVDSMSEADEIVVLDTGSTDKTVEKLKARGIKVEVKEIIPWRFDVARNESMKLIPSDCNILVCTDLDEVFDKGWSKPLREKWIEGKHRRGFYKYIWSHLSNGAPGRVFIYDKIHSRDWGWKFPVHETLWNYQTNSIDYTSEQCLYLNKEVTLQHYPDYTKSRSSYLPLLELRRKESPEDFNGLVYLAHEYSYQKMYEKANTTLEEVIQKSDSALTTASSYLFMGDNYCALKKYDAAKNYYLKAIEELPDYREPYLNLAKMLIDLERYESAIWYIKKGLEKSVRHYSWLERDKSWNVEPYDLLSLAYYYSGDKLKSLGCAFKAWTYNNKDERILKNIEKITNNIKDKDLIK